MTAYYDKFIMVYSVDNKAKGQSVRIAKSELTGLCYSCGGLAEWPNAPDSKSGDRARNTARGFKSYTRRQINKPHLQR